MGADQGEEGVEFFYRMEYGHFNIWSPHSVNT